MQRIATATLLPAIAGVLLSGCSPDTTTALDATDALEARAGYTQPGTHRQYGAPVRIGEGAVRTYVVLDARNDQKPLELGIAIDERAMNSLPSTMQMLHLPLPQKAPAPYRSVMFDWNPEGHEPDGIYTHPHFDFHFYMTSHEEVMSILPTDPEFADKGNNLPAEAYVPPFYIVPVAPGDPPASAVVPQMGLHWVDVRSPELQGLLGNPAGYADFTRTFIYGSWDGEITFLEPMITRATIMAAVDEQHEIPVPAAVQRPGWYPNAYRITHDTQAKEYRVSLTGFSWRD